MGLVQRKASLNKYIAAVIKDCSKTFTDKYFVEDGNCLIYFYFDDRDIVNMIRVSEAEIILEDNEAYAREFQNAR